MLHRRLRMMHTLNCIRVSAPQFGRRYRAEGCVCARARERDARGGRDTAVCEQGTRLGSAFMDPTAGLSCVCAREQSMRLFVLNVCCHDSPGHIE